MGTSIGAHCARAGVHSQNIIHVDLSRTYSLMAMVQESMYYRFRSVCVVDCIGRIDVFHVLQGEGDTPMGSSRAPPGPSERPHGWRRCEHSKGSSHPTKRYLHGLATPKMCGVCGATTPHIHLRITRDRC